MARTKSIRLITGARKFFCITLPKYAPILASVFILLCSGCSWFADNRIAIKPKPIDTTSYEFRQMLSMIVKQRYKTELTIDEIMFEIAYAEYKLTTE